MSRRCILFVVLLQVYVACVAGDLSSAWSLRYVSVDSLLCAVDEDASYEGKCLVGYACAMRADYAGAEAAYSSVLGGCDNALPVMEAQVGMMRVCQRRGDNRRFYEYYAGAQESARRLQGAIGLMDADEQRRWQTVQTDLHMLLCVYYYYQRQELEAEGEYAWLESRMHLLEGDTAQLAYFYFLRGNRKGQESMADLELAAELAERVGAVYVWAKAVGSMVEASPPASLSQGAGEASRIVLAQRVREAFEAYGSPFDVSQTWLLEGRLWLDIDADSALYCMERAWEVLPAGERCPEWRADVHEGLCMAYSALGDKAEADMHRNSYLDIIDSTREDHRLSQRVEALEREERAVVRGLWLAGGGAVLLLVVLMWMLHRLRRRHGVRYAAELEALEGAMCALVGRSDASVLALSEYGEHVDALRRLSEQRGGEQQRAWVEKQACLSIVGSITPLIDRMLHAIGKAGGVRYEVGGEEACWQRTYISELCERVKVLNEVLTQWISLRKGMVGLRIETFALQELLDIVAKSRGQFERAGIELVVEATDVWLKADRALTLFMLNTLLDNARKYTASGGRVRVRVKNGSGGVVELSVEDTGGGDGSSGESHGFGLMNCRGIIEQYRKTSRRFDCCAMGNEQREEGGSIYWFRLPLAKALIALCLLLARPVQAQDWRTITDAPADGSLPAPTVYAEADSLLAQADSCAWVAYDCNIAGDYEGALAAVDEACLLISRHVGLVGEGMTEIDWWEAGIRTDFHLLLDLHNEAAIAALALKDWDTYAHHNELYTRLYKLMAQDPTLEGYCQRTAQRAADKRVLLMLVSVLALMALLVYYVVYYRNHILMVYNMRQLLETCQRLTEEANTERLVDIIAEGIGAIRPTEGVALLTEGEPVHFSQHCPQRDYVSHCLQRVKSEELRVKNYSPETYEGRVFALPLVIEEGQRIGAMCIVLQRPPTDTRQRQELDALLALLARHAATAIYYSTVRSEQMQSDIALKEDEQRRAQTEAEHLHVRNMIVDNALSALKHETMYYPTRIQQLASREDCAPEQLRELATYYREIFTTLSACAVHALGKPLMRRERIEAQQFGQWMETAMERQGQKLLFTLHSSLFTLHADACMLQYLADCLAQWIAHAASEKKTTFACTQSEKFVMFALTFPAQPWTESQLQEAFFPESLATAPHNQALLIAKQIVRLHDEHVRRGCRIELSQADDTLTLSLALPAG